MNSNTIAGIDDVVGQFFAAFDNRNGRVPSVDALEALFSPTSVVASHSGSAVSICTVAEFARPRVLLLSSGRLVNFCEWETQAENRVIDSLAIRSSKYSKSGQLDGRPYSGSGTKFFQLARVGGTWRIAALSWIDEVVSPDGPNA